MMNPQLFEILSNDAAVTDLLGTNPVRIFPWGRAPQKVEKPYAVYSVYNANPENYLDSVPDIYNKGTQINVYANSSKSLEDCFIAIRDSLEPSAHMTSYTTPDQDSETNLFSCRMEFDFWEAR